MKFILILLFTLLHHPIFGQSPNVTKDISAIVFLDSFVVTATKRGFNVEDFIDIVQKDESFYQAFHNLRFQPHKAENQVEIFNRKHAIKAANYHTIEQFIDGNCRTMQYLKEEIKGKFYKKKKIRKHKYYTARMHEQIFLTKGKICGNPNNSSITQHNLSGIEKHINELKKLIFQPGKEVDVPFIGGKTAIFEEKMIKHYDFYISSKTFGEDKECYVFRAVVKPETSTNKTIIKYLETYFDKEDFQVVARNYHLKYDSLFDFDIRMKVSLTQYEGKYLPEKVSYQGNWKIPTQTRERVQFLIDFEY